MNKKQMDNTLKKDSLIGWLLVLGILMIMAGAALLYLFRDYGKAILDTQKNQLLNISESVANSIEVYLANFQRRADGLLNLEQFETARTRMGEGHREAMEKLLEEAREGSPEEIACMRYVSGDGTSCLAGSPGEFRTVHEMGSGNGFQDTSICRDPEGVFYFRLSAADGNNGVLELYVPVRKVYENTASYIRMGEEGYVMIKDSEGIILMHPVEAQIGIDVLSDRMEMYPEFDYSELEVLIAHQLAGESGVETYYSYWWADDPPSRVRKVSAYVPAHIGNDFLSISAVMDYAEISAPVQNVGLRILLLSILLAVSIILFLLLIYRSISRQMKIARENIRLKQINEELERLHQQEEQLAQQQRLQLIGTMTSGIAHEFNNLLTPIMGYSAMILEGMPEEDENYEDMREILSSAEKAKSIIDQITQFSRKNAEKMLSPIHMGEAVGKALIITEAAKPRNVKMESSLETETDLCMGNSVQIHQMIVNLCNNAIHAIGSEAGTLRIVGEAVRPEEEKEPWFRGKENSRFYRITVFDTGCGMDPETASQIFIPFFTTKKPGEGTGLGLAVVQRLVEAHQGYIQVFSRPGEGTRFVIWLPLLES